MTTKRRGICPVCDRAFDVTVLGRMRSHSVRRRTDQWGRGPECDGAGQPPKAFVKQVTARDLLGIDPNHPGPARWDDADLSEAEERGYRRAVQALRDAARQRQDEGNSTLWATYSVGADFLDCRLDAAPRNEGAQTT